MKIIGYQYKNNYGPQNHKLIRNQGSAEFCQNHVEIIDGEKNIVKITVL